MNNERTSHRIKRLATALLAVPMAAVVLTTSPVSASTAPEGELVAPSVIESKGQSTAAARTDGSAVIELPAFTATPCPELTDSIVRLYTAYFLRAPEEGGFSFWLEEYSAGNWSLPRMSAHFSQSQEFVDTYGGITDEQFIDLIYTNIFGRAADQGGRDYWLGRMATEGLDRGTVMLFFSESPEYIEQSGTFTPLAGEFNWYPEGTTWACGFENLEMALPAGAVFADIVFYNSSPRPNDIVANLMVDGVWQQWDATTIESTAWYVFFGRDLTDARVTGLQLQASDQFIWTLVISPTATPTVRAGWELF